ncbi:Uncharacterized conserved protein, DUF2252 family [Granulicella pectinivorans]|uniref:Uncharacterized conserved protein, DUF2252 family n=2 Tax=Granulicella pectinivorans TaxID=474950 RepID=A0A1I6LTF7_9BACT|nr:Uncharacterized conserved protein, DUF2252 family [Granulicella pectinivorans]
MQAVEPSRRMAVLEQQRRVKMARSAHAYVRGNTLQFYEWLASGSGDKLPQGPAVWICGDCHAGNLGPVANAEGRVEIQIRDLDQTVVGNPAHDLVRLGLSLATAARGSDLPGVTTALMLEQMVLGYGQALSAPRKAAADHEAVELRPIRLTMRAALSRKWRHLAEERIEDETPVIPLGDRFWALTDEERAEVERIVKEAKSDLLLGGNKLRVLDAAYWMKGCSSLGKLRFAVLVGVGKKQDQCYRLLDIKEAVTAAAPMKRAVEMPGDNAARVVAGAKALSPYLGDRMVAAHFKNRPVVMRALMPQDLKVEVDRLTREEAVATAHYLASVVGKAHVRQMDTATRKRWKAELGRNRSKSLDAPGWLWQSVVELVAEHEAAYLEHCRRYALGDCIR